MATGNYRGAGRKRKLKEITNNERGKANNGLWVFLNCGCLIALLTIGRLSGANDQNARRMEQVIQPTVAIVGQPQMDSDSHSTTTIIPEALAQTTQEDQMTPATEKPNRTIAIIMGSFRGGEYAWQSLATNVLDPSSADLALLIPENDATAKKSSLYKRAKYIWTFRDYKDWGDAIDLIGGRSRVVWRRLLKTHTGRVPSIFGGAKGEPGSGAIIMMLRWFVQQHIREENLTEKYDRFMISRSDHYYQCTHNVSAFEVGNRTVWIPPGQDDFSGLGPIGRGIIKGKTDRHLVAGSEDVLDALDVYPTYFHTKWLKTRNIFNTENLLYNVWREKGIISQHFPRVMFTVTLETDVSRWGEPAKAIPQIPGLFLKYPREHWLTQKACPPIQYSQNRTAEALWQAV